MENFQNYPLKVYIQDIFRATRTQHNKYFYQLFGLTFKNIELHGVVTSLYNRGKTSTNLELSDGTGTVQVYFDWSKCNKHVHRDMMTSLHRDFINQMQTGGDNLGIISKMMAAITEKNDMPVNLEEGVYLRVIGDIFVDELKGSRMVSAFECNNSSVERDIVWLQELRYVYEQSYLRTKV